jgi:hypothetical protein
MCALQPCSVDQWYDWLMPSWLNRPAREPKPGPSSDKPKPDKEPSDKPDKGKPMVPPGDKPGKPGMPDPDNNSTCADKWYVDKEETHECVCDQLKKCNITGLQGEEGPPGPDGFSGRNGTAGAQGTRGWRPSRWGCGGWGASDALPSALSWLLGTADSHPVLGASLKTVGRQKQQAIRVNFNTVEMKPATVASYCSLCVTPTHPHNHHSNTVRAMCSRACASHTMIRRLQSAFPSVCAFRHHP